MFGGVRRMAPLFKTFSGNRTPGYSPSMAITASYGVWKACDSATTSFCVAVGLEFSESCTCVLPSAVSSGLVDLVFFFFPSTSVHPSPSADVDG